MTLRQQIETGRRWAVVSHYANPKMVPSPDRPGWQQIDPNEEPEVRVVDQTDRDRWKGPFSTVEEGRAQADRLNLADVEATLDPAFADRRKRLRRLGETFWMRYGEGDPLSRVDEKPGRYAVQSWSERYSESFWETHETLEDVEVEVLTGGVHRIVDLDTGEDVPFTLTAEVGP